MMLAASACRLDDVRSASRLHNLLPPYAGRIAIARPLVVVVGPVDEGVGALAALLGRLDEAERHFANALALAQRMRALPWDTLLRTAWAAMLLHRDASGDRARAAALLDEA